MFGIIFKFIAILGALAVAAMVAFYGEVFAVLRDVLLDSAVALGLNVSTATKVGGGCGGGAYAVICICTNQCIFFQVFYTQCIACRNHGRYFGWGLPYLDPQLVL